MLFKDFIMTLEKISYPFKHLVVAHSYDDKNYPFTKHKIHKSQILIAFLFLSLKNR